MSVGHALPSQSSGPMDDFQMYQASRVALFHAKFQLGDVKGSGCHDMSKENQMACNIEVIPF